jgi:hypothetical protein
VEIRNKELELEVRQQRDLLINMRDLLMRCQQENDVVRPYPPLLSSAFNADYRLLPRFSFGAY